MASRLLRLRWPASCSICGRALPKDTEAQWNSETKTASCLVCPDSLGRETPASPGVAGGSVRRQYERRAGRELRVQEQAVANDAAWRHQVVEAHPVIGRLKTMTTPKPVVTGPSQRTQRWAEGAAGEELLGRNLATLPDTVISLHDRRIPDSKANIDHIAIAPTGVFVVDAKNYAGRIDVRDVGPWYRPDERLYVNGRDRTRLLDGVERQVETVMGVVPDTVPVQGVLCFVGENWPVLLRRPINIRGVAVLWPSKLLKQLRRPGSLRADQVAEIAKQLSVELPAA